MKIKSNEKIKTGSNEAVILRRKKSSKDVFLTELRQNWQLYLLMVIPFLYILIFKYVPMWGAQVAFRNYTPVKGVLNSEWVGLTHFIKFFSSAKCWQIIWNTLSVNLYGLLLAIPFPIIFAICLEYCKSKKFKKTVQMSAYLPHFLSVVIVVGMMNLILDNRIGVVNNILFSLTGEKINFLGKSDYFRSLYVWSGIWQNTGWSSILYIAALSGVDPQIHEAAIIDGANKFRRIWHIDLTSIRPTIAIVIIMNMGSIFSLGVDKTLLMQNPTNLKFSEVLSTYEYKVGIGGTMPNYSYASAIGLMTVVVNFIFILISNKISNKITGNGLW